MKACLHFVSVLLVACDIGAVCAKDIDVDSTKAFENALAIVEPGDSLVLRMGEWRDSKLIFHAQGTESNPITLKAQQEGKTVLTGKSTLRIGGKYLVVEGLLFQDPDPAVIDLIEFRIDSEEPAHSCRMTNCAVVNTVHHASGESRWLGLYGSGNRVDRCHFEGKSNKGTTCVVWLGGDNRGRHRIDHNYFGPRKELGANGGETIRVGDSKTSLLDARCVVEHNLFERCNGETECISNKSCENIYRENTFLEVSGTLTLRHGNGCLVERNVFLGNDVRGTGGIRIIGEDHVVRSNFLTGLTGDDGRSAISVTMGIPDSPAHRYFQVKRAVVENNSIVDCEHPLLIGLSDDKNATLAPIETLIRGNVIVAPQRTIVEARCSLAGIRWEENQFFGKKLGIPPTDGISWDAGEPTILSPLSRADVGTTW